MVVAVRVDVVVPAQEHEVVEAGWSAVFPVPDVVAVAPVGWPVAAGVGAAAVARFERAADRGGDRAGRAADVEHL